MGMAKASNWTRTGTGVDRGVRVVSVLALTNGGARMTLRETSGGDNARVMSIDFTIEEACSLADMFGKEKEGV